MCVEVGGRRKIENQIKINLKRNKNIFLSNIIKKSILLVLLVFDTSVSIACVLRNQKSFESVAFLSEPGANV